MVSGPLRGPLQPALARSPGTGASGSVERADDGLVDYPSGGGLSDAASALVRRMSVFAAPADPGMLAGLLAEPATGPPTGLSTETEVRVLLSELVERGLVTRADGSVAGCGPAYRLVTAARGPAADLLAAAGELGAAEDAHTQVVIELAVACGAAVNGSDEPGSAVAVAELTRSEPDLRLVLARLTGRAQVHDGVRLACALVPFVLHRGYDGLVGPALTSLLHQPVEQLDVAPRVAEQRTPDRTTDGTTTRATARNDQELSRRERDVLAELATGATNKEIAVRLGLAPKTVMHHTMAVYRKLGVRGRADATAWAFRHGVVS